MANDLKDGKPVFTGLNWHRQPGFSLFIPNDWQRFSLGEGREGVAFSPAADDRQTVILAEVVLLEHAIVAGDLDDLREGFLEGLRALPGAQVDEHKDWTVGDTVCLEATSSFLEGDARRYRWTRVLYKAKRQTTFLAQAPSARAFATWKPVFYEALMTAKLHTTAPGPQAVPAVATP